MKTRLLLLTTLSLALAACTQPAEAQPRPVPVPVNTGTAPAAGSTPIHDLQGSTPAGDVASMLAGKPVTVGGVVTEVRLGTGTLGGFFLQARDADADSDATSSEGVFVYCTVSAPTSADPKATDTSPLCKPLKVGDQVQVAGTVTEFKTSTQIDTLSALNVVASGVALPSAARVSFPLATGQGDLERYEGMRVTVPSTLSVTSTFELGRFGQLTLSSGGRVFTPTNGQGGSAADNVRRTLIIDDGISTQNPATLPFLNGAAPLNATRRTGDAVTDLTGALNYSFGAYTVYPSSAPFVDANPRPATPKAVGGTLKVAGANVLNYFTALIDSNDGCTPDGTDKVNSRGANNCTEFLRQQAKIVQMLKGLNADVVTLMEVQNNGDRALNNLLGALNTAYGSTVYSVVQTGTLGTDQIHVAVIYKGSSVTPVGAFMVDNDAVHNRPPLAQTFSQVGTGAKFSVIANHFKSKGGCPKAGTDLANQDSGQGCWNDLRRKQAAALLKFVGTVKTTSGDPDVLLMGDFNAYGAEDPVNDLTAGGFESLNLRIPADDRYSYQFGGTFGYLDHAFGSASLGTQVAGITEWHVNSDEPVILDYNTEFKVNPSCASTTCTSPDLNNVAGSPTPFRASDHDPVLVGLDLK